MLLSIINDKILKLLQMIFYKNFLNILKQRKMKNPMQGEVEALVMLTA